MDKRKEIYDGLVKLGIRHPRVEKVHPVGFRFEGWYYTEFNSSEPQWLGLDMDDVLERLADVAYWRQMDDLAWEFHTLALFYRAKIAAKKGGSNE
jgi:peptidoglycan/xylan/chitin deacetylase (PgdA/CDA1 family)